MRFKGFDGEWERRKMRDIAEVNPKDELPELFEYVDLESVVGIEMVTHRTETRLSAPSRAQRLARKGDLFYQTVRPYQKNNYLFEDGSKHYVFSTGYAQLRPRCDGYFLLALVQDSRFVISVLTLCTGTSYPAISATDLVDVEVIMPKGLPEQAAIGTFFKCLDEQITQKGKRLEKTRNIKAALLEKMFPEHGKSVPEVRGKGFAGEWNRQKLGDIAVFSKGVGYSKNDLCEKGTPIILYGRLYTNYETVMTHIDTFVVPKQNSVYSNGDEILIPASGETAEDISRASAVLKTGIILGGDLNIVRLPLALFDTVFLSLMFFTRVVSNELGRRAQGKTIVHVHSSDLQTLYLLIPPKAEQAAIGVFFRKLDSLITLYEQELEKLKQIKLAMLERMFV